MEPYHLGMVQKWPVEGSCRGAAPAVPEGDVVGDGGDSGAGGSRIVLPRSVSAETGSQAW